MMSDPAWTALDTNVLVYAEGVNGPDRQEQARAVLSRLTPGSVVVPVQVLGELFNVLTRKAKWPPTKASAVLSAWSASCSLPETSAEVLIGAVELSSMHQLSIWDAVILSAASVAGCTVLLSEDMHDGFVWRGTTVRNPFPARSAH